MDLNPFHLAKKLVSGVETFARHPLETSEQIALNTGYEADWLALNARELVHASSWKEAGNRLMIMAGSPAPHNPNLLPCPPADAVRTSPVTIAPGTPQELLPAKFKAAPLNLSDPARGAKIPVTLPRAGEGQLTLRAAGPGTDWGTRGHASAVASIYVDGRYNQDVVLYGGAKMTDYPVALGHLGAGPHEITIGYNRKGSTSGAMGVQVGSAQLATSRDDAQGMAERYQPFFYGRGMDNNHTDVPLKMWATMSHHGADTVIDYNVIHSNEDGGTAADPALEQATWGRMTDPDGIASVTVGPDGKVKRVEYDGQGDTAFKFGGKFQNGHPILRVATSNNNYSDQGTTPMLFRPRVELKDFKPGETREDLMDAQPWMYKIANTEITREGKVLNDADAAAMLAREGQKGFHRGTKVEDLRNYLYIEYDARSHNQPLAVEVQLKGGNQWYSSDLGDKKLDISRDGGPQRTSVALPPGATPSDVAGIRIVNHGMQEASVQGVVKAFMLDNAYTPQYMKLGDTHGAASAGQTVDVKLAN